MKKYLKKILLFALLYLPVIYGVNKYMFHKAHKSFLWSVDFETLILGDSGMFLLNEHELQNSINLSMKGSIYKVNYYKLKEIHRHKEIKNLVIPFSFSNISKYSDDMLSGTRNTEEYMRRLYPLTNPFNLFTDRTDFRSAAKVFTKYVLAFNTKYYKSFEPIEAECLFRDTIFNVNKTNSVRRPHIPNPESILTISSNSNYLDQRMPGLFPEGNVKLSQSSISYLDKIIEYTSANDINLYLVRMPLTTKYQKRVPQECKAKYNQLINAYRQQAHIQYLDYMNHYKNEQTVIHFGNDDHTTAYGAAMVSKELNKIINR